MCVALHGHAQSLCLLIVAARKNFAFLGFLNSQTGKARTMKNIYKILTTAVVLTFSTQTFVAVAATKTLKKSAITMKAGTRAALQDVYSWDDRCRTVRVKVTPRSTSLGNVFVVRERFVISKAQSKKCAGKTVKGFRVVFKARRPGNTVAQYGIRSKALPHTYIVSRKMQIKQK